MTKGILTTFPTFSLVSILIIVSMPKTETKIFIETSEGVMSLKQISEKTGIELPIIRNRYYRGVRGDELLKPKSERNKPIEILYDGKIRTLAEISSLTGLDPDTIYQRYKKRGISGEGLFVPSREKHSTDYYIGKTYGRLTVLSLSYNPNTRMYISKCKCECGSVKEYDFNRLRNGNTTSCGCYLRDIRGKASITHNMSKSKEYNTWRHIKERCFNKKSEFYDNYGGRGITMCERWKDSFEHFFADMGYAPSSEHSIDRINVNGNYEPGNCRWATDRQQGQNKRATFYITYGGRIKSTCEWEDLLGLKRGRLRAAYKRGVDMVSYIDRIRQGEVKHIFPLNLVQKH